MTVLLSLVGMGLLILFMVAEFHVIKRGGKSWKWCQRVYDKFNLQRINW